MGSNQGGGLLRQQFPVIPPRSVADPEPLAVSNATLSRCSAGGCQVFPLARVPAGAAVVAVHEWFAGLGSLAVSVLSVIVFRVVMVVSREGRRKIIVHEVVATLPPARSVAKKLAIV